MQWNNKFIYPKSTRSIVQGSRHYSVNEENLPSVTTILKATESEEKKAKLAEWKNRVGHKQAEIISACLWPTLFFHSANLAFFSSDSVAFKIVVTEGRFSWFTA